jgi:hypothetical protein
LRFIINYYVFADFFTNADIHCIWPIDQDSCETNIFLSANYYSSKYKSVLVVK